LDLGLSHPTTSFFFRHYRAWGWLRFVCVGPILVGTARSQHGWGARCSATKCKQTTITCSCNPPTLVECCSQAREVVLCLCVFCDPCGACSSCFPCALGIVRGAHLCEELPLTGFVRRMISTGKGEKKDCERGRVVRTSKHCASSYSHTPKLSSSVFCCPNQVGSSVQKHAVTGIFFAGERGFDAEKHPAGVRTELRTVQRNSFSFESGRTSTTLICVHSPVGTCSLANLHFHN
jgi:hypothetical protein